MSETLAGSRVVSFATGAAGNLAARTLAELGADVLKVETPLRPDPLRGLGPPTPGSVSAGDGTRELFAALARSVRGLALDPSAAATPARLGRLLEQSDGVLQTSPGGDGAVWGLDDDAIAGLNRRIVIARLVESRESGAGASWTRARATALGTHLAVALLAGLERRDRIAGAVTVVVCADAVHEALDTASAIAEPTTLHCADGRRLIVDCRDDADCERVLSALGCTDGEDGPVARRAADALRARSERCPAADIASLLVAHGVPAQTVQTPAEVLRDSHLHARGVFVPADDAAPGPPTANAPVHRLSATPPRVRRPAPRLGEHTADLVAEILDDVVPAPDATDHAR